MVISFRRFGTTCRSSLQGSRIQNKACGPNTEFIYERLCAVEGVSSVELIQGVGWREVQLIEGIVTGVVARRWGALTLLPQGKVPDCDENNLRLGWGKQKPYRDRLKDISL